uniref:Uncharacterized protein n=1 Tax=Oryza meridionalis TaxID=40149 RepID=A0A0E0D2V5_9ORYZ
MWRRWPAARGRGSAGERREDGEKARRHWQVARGRGDKLFRQIQKSNASPSATVLTVKDRARSPRVPCRRCR